MRRIPAAGELHAARPHFLYANARRFPVAELMGRHASDALALLDRPDAVREAFRLGAGPRGVALLDAASLALGVVLRDASVLTHALRGARTLNDRQALVVALALLGERLEPALAAPDASDPADTEAFVLAASLATLEARRAAGAVREEHSRTRSAAREVTERTPRHLDAGRLFDVLR